MMREGFYYLNKNIQEPNIDLYSDMIYVTHVDMEYAKERYFEHLQRWVRVVNPKHLFYPHFYISETRQNTEKLFNE